MGWVRGLALGALGLSTTVALAQQTGGVPAEGLVIEEIVVTARKQAESLQTVPVAITAFTADDIEAAGIQNLYDIATLTPGLAFDTMIGEFLAIPTIRGLTQNDLFGDVNNVEIFLDGVNVSGRSGLNFNMLDVERIEVVKGPQSALYGRNSFAGAINFVTQRAPDYFKGKTSATVGNDGTLRGSVGVGGPITDTLRGRMSVGYDEFDGSYKNNSPGGEDMGGHRYRTWSGGLEWSPLDVLDVRLNTYFSNDHVGPAAVTVADHNCAPHTAPPFRLTAFCGKLPAGDEVASKLAADPRGWGESRKVFRTSLQVDWRTPIGELTSLTGYNTLRHHAFNDATRLAPPSLWAYYNVPPPAAPQVFASKLFRQDYDKVEEFSQELRLSGGEDTRLRWTAGLYYYNQKYNSGLDAVTLSTLPADFVSFPVPPGPVGAAINAMYMSWFTTGDAPVFRRDDRETDSYAAFGALEFDVTDDLRARVEARHTYERKEQFAPANMGVVNPNPRKYKDHWNSFTPRFTLDYRTPVDVFVYASAAKGVKAGGFNESALIESERSYRPEKNWTYELGSKGSLLDGRVSFDAAIFYVDWDDMQLPALASGTSPIPATVTLNVGTATSKGFELALRARLTEGLTANLGYARTKAEFDHAASRSLISQVPAIFGPTGGDISDFDLPRFSPRQWNVGLDYRQFAFGDFDFFGRVDFSHKSPQRAMTDGLTKIGSIERLNARMGFESEQWRFELWGENLTDDDAAIAAFRDTWLNNWVEGALGSNVFRTSVSYPKLRTYGVTATYKF
ncbi:MAG: TonB-dependent receptor [Gammaproteobacteria bacterium]|nr:TonB-dependent receptor [Gammaproteobacteria bacterium]